MKRARDLLIALLAALVLSPILLLVAFLNAIYLGRPLIFQQERPGLNAHPFCLLKFRTMKHAINVDGELLPDTDRLTKYGRLLRSTSLDELPSLWNVIKGDISLVGPRPLLMEYLPLYNEQQFRRHEVRPGITGWAQVNGRNAISWEARFEADIWYIDNRSFLLDLKILAMTIKKVFARDGISAEGEATMPRFTGNQT